MPKTKLQGVVFTMMMVFSMVFCMSVYTMSIREGGLNYNIFFIALKEMWVEFIIVFILIFFFITKRVQKAAFIMADRMEGNSILTVVLIRSLTVMTTVPIITLIATFLHNGFTENWLTQWLTTAALCFPAAYCLQIFFIGPLVQLLFRKIFV